MIVKLHLFIVSSSIIISFFISLIFISHLLVLANLSHVMDCIHITTMLITYKKIKPK